MIKYSDLKRIETSIKDEVREIQESLIFYQSKDWKEFLALNGLESGVKKIKDDKDNQVTLVEFSYHCAQGANAVIGVNIWRKYPKEKVTVKHDGWDGTITFYHLNPYPGTEEHIPLEEGDIMSPALERP